MEDAVEPPGGPLEIRRAADRFVSRRPGIETRHCLSFGAHYDRSRTSVGPLIALNDERLEPNAGYPAHEHRDVEIVTWVVEGTLAHTDSLGNRSVVRPGTVQRLTAGPGVTHSESNAGPTGEVLRFVQLWFSLGGADVAPAYDVMRVAAHDQDQGFTTIAGGSPSPLTLAVPGVEVKRGHLPRGTRATAGGGGEWVLYVVNGTLRTTPGGLLETGDWVRAGGPPLGLSAEDDSAVLLVEPSLRVGPVPQAPLSPTDPGR